MKRSILAVAILIVLLSSIPVGAADLQAGWYVKIEGVDAFQYQWDPYGGGNRFIFATQFTTPIGQYGPFTVTDGNYHWSRSRHAYVTQNAYGISAEQSLVLPIDLGMYSGIEVTSLNITFSTNYDPTKMWLGLWQRKPDQTATLLWSQPLGGQRSGGGSLHDPVIEGDYYFKLTVVPEPSTLLSLLSLAGLTTVARRRK